MEIRHLRYLVAIVQEMSFSAAAKKLHFAQPALSQNVRLMEEELGVKLFERDSRHVAPTNAGKALYRDAVLLLAHFQSAERTAQRTARGEAGSLSIGFTATAILGGDLPELLRAYSQKYPDVSLKLQDYAVDVLVEKLQSSTIDIACTEEIWTGESFASRPLTPLPVVMAMHKSHPLANQSKLRLEMFADEPFLLPTPYSVWTLHDTMIRACQQAGFTPICRGYADNIPVAVGKVASQFGVALIHQLPLFRCPEVVFRKLDNLPLELSMHLVWKRDTLSPVAQNFLELQESLKTATETTAAVAEL